MKVVSMYANSRRYDKRILFVCQCNICRSQMAEFVMKDLVRMWLTRGTPVISTPPGATCLRAVRRC